MAGLTAQGRDLGTRVSSLFEIPDKRLTAIGSSITSYACDPRLSEDTGRPAKKVCMIHITHLIIVFYI